MTEVALRKFRFKRDKKQEWMDWCRELNRRQDEVLETLRNEGVSVEACFLSPDEDCVYYFLEVENFEQAHKAYSASQYPIDEEHRRHKRASMEEVGMLRCLFYFKNVPRS
jgi:L-rhamnose mutarotase